MATKTKQNDNSNHSEWKSLVQGFVENVLERLSDNVLTRVHNWTDRLKRRAIGSLVMVLGATYLFTGLSTYAEATLGKSNPGLGYGAVGVVALIVGYLVSRK